MMVRYYTVDIIKNSLTQNNYTANHCGVIYIVGTRTVLTQNYHMQ